jgi:hypothetical protein
MWWLLIEQKAVGESQATECQEWENHQILIDKGAVIDGGREGIPSAVREEDRWSELRAAQGEASIIHSP